MARYFREQDIDEFRDCFNLNAKDGMIHSLDELTVIMRSLGMSPTIRELRTYFRNKNGKISFADFLEVMHTHSQKENIPLEIINAFRASDPSRTGQIPARELRRILINWGERLSPKEVDRIFREANVQMGGYVRYEDFIKVVCAPVPDYY